MTGSLKEIVFGGGCFWCTEAVFQRLKGVIKVTPGYTGGHTPDPGYREVCSGRTGHNEVVMLEYDPMEITLKDLLRVFFISHDPTTLNRQGNDVGTQYRSGIYCSSADQLNEVKAFIEGEAKELWHDPIVTELALLDVFYPAEDYHHNYYNDHRMQGYCQIIINPKIKKLRQHYKGLLKDGQE